MKLVTFVDDDQERIGAIIDGSASGQIVDLHRAYASYLRAVENAATADRMAAATLGSDMIEFLKRGDKALAAARAAIEHAATEGGNGNVVERQRVRSDGAGAPSRRAGLRRKKLFRSRRRNVVEKRPGCAGRIS